MMKEKLPLLALAPRATVSASALIRCVSKDERLQNPEGVMRHMVHTWALQGCLYPDSCLYYKGFENNF